MTACSEPPGSPSPSPDAACNSATAADTPPHKPKLSPPTVGRIEAAEVLTWSPGTITAWIAPCGGGRDADRRAESTRSEVYVILAAGLPADVEANLLLHIEAHRQDVLAA
jgi:hypothetical protein